MPAMMPLWQPYLAQTPSRRRPTVIRHQCQCWVWANLVVCEDNGRILIRGQAPTYHAKQLALYGALQLLSGDRLHTEITVG